MAKKLLLVMRWHQLSFSAQRAQWRAVAAAAAAAARSLALSAYYALSLLPAFYFKGVFFESACVRAGV